MSQKTRAEALKEALELKAELKRRAELPHLYKYPHYQWGLDYMNSTERMKLICAGNQVSKSSTQIRHVIDLATNPLLWPSQFPRRNPKVFWYIYPDQNKINEEWDQKWSEFMPNGSMKDHPLYGWEQSKVNSNRTLRIKFNTGVILLFKTWRQDFQSSTLDAVFVDEEIPFEKYDELNQRLMAQNGIFSMVFTATIGQKQWHDTMELMGKEGELFPHAFKKQISMEHDCQFYADGTPSPFTPEEVERRKASCSSEREIDRRIHGRFVSLEGLAFPSFDRKRNVIDRQPFEPGWLLFGGVDIGTGGLTGHPAAISIVAVRPDFKKGRLIRFWRGSKGETTNTSDILNKYIEMTKGLNMTGSFYDWHSKEFYLRAQAAGVPFQPAVKDRTFGFDLLNTLFKHQMLDLEEGPHTEELIYELEYLKVAGPKTRAEDDGVDSLRYAISVVAWDMTGVVFGAFVERKVNSDDKKKRVTRHENPYDPEKEDVYNLENDIDEFNDLLEAY